MFELGNDAGESFFDRFDGAVRVVLALLFKTAPMFEKFFPVEIGQDRKPVAGQALRGPRTRGAVLRLCHVSSKSSVRAQSADCQRIFAYDCPASATSRALRAAISPPMQPTAMPPPSRARHAGPDRNTTDDMSTTPAIVAPCRP